MAITKQEKPFMAEDVGTDFIDVRYLGPSTQYQPTRIIHKADGQVGNKPSLCIIMEHRYKNAVVGQISLEMLNEALSDIGYQLVKI